MKSSLRYVRFNSKVVNGSRPMWRERMGQWRSEEGFKSGTAASEAGIAAALSLRPAMKQRRIPLSRRL